MSRILLVLAVGAGIPGSLGAVKTTQGLEVQWNRCVNFDPQKDDEDLAIGACNALLQAGRYANNDLAQVLTSRGFIYRVAKDNPTQAVRDVTRALELADTADAQLRSSAHVERARAHDKLKNNQAALADFDRAIEIRPNDAFAYSLRGSFRYNTLHDLDRAFDDWTRAYQLDPSEDRPHDYVHALVDRGDRFVSQSKYDRAIADYSEALPLEDVYMVGNIRFKRARAYRLSRQFARAIAELDDLVRGNPKLVDPVLERGLTQLSAGQDAAAVVDLSRALELQPKNATALFARGVARQGLREWEVAEVDFRAAKALDARVSTALMSEGIFAIFRPESPFNGIVESGRRRLADRDYKAAAVDFTSALSLDAKSVAVLVLRSDAYVGLSDYVRAIADLTTAIAAGSPAAELFYRRGLLYAMGILPPHGPGTERERAIQDFTEVIRRDPRHAGAFMNRAQLYGVIEDYARAIEDYTVTVALEPDDVWHRISLAKLLGRVGREVEAVASLESARPRDSNANKWVTLALGNALIQSGQFRRASEKYETLLATDRQNQNAWAGVCLARAAAGDLQKALADCNEGLAIVRAARSSDDPDILESRGYVYFRLGQLDAALADFSKAVESWAYDGAVRSLYARAVIQQRRGDTAGVAAAFERARKFAPAIAEQMARLGVAAR